MIQSELKKEFYALYDMMASSQNVNYMRTFGNVHKEMMEWMIANRPDAAQEWIEKLESIRWKNYLTQKEAQRIVDAMEPKAPWPREQWKAAMQQHGYKLEEEPCYNSCALWVVMNMIMSDSSETLERYLGNGDIFKIVHELAIDKLKDADGRFCVRAYFGV